MARAAAEVTTPAFSDEARQVLARARAAARRLCHDYLGTEHLLLGLLDERRGVASAVLHQANIEERKVRAALAALAPPSAATSEAEISEFVLAPALRRALRLATAETERLRNDTVQSEHLLLAIMHEGTAGAATTLAALGLDLETLRVAVAREHHSHEEGQRGSGWVAHGPLWALAWLGAGALVAAAGVVVWAIGALAVHRSVSLAYVAALTLALVAVGLTGLGSSRMEAQRTAALLEARVDQWRQRRAPAQVAQALRLAETGRVDQAEELLLLAIARPMPETEYRETLLALAPWLATSGWRPLALRARAELHLHAAHLDLALADARAAVLAAPRQAEWCQLLGRVLARTGRTREAAVAYRQACALAPTNGVYWTDLASTLLQLGELSEAEMACAQAVRLAPEVARAQAVWGLRRLLVGELDAAATALDRALALDADEVSAQVLQAALLLRNGQAGRALALTRRGVSATCEPPIWLAALEGWALAALGHTTEARLAFARARVRDAALLPACERLATALAELGYSEPASYQHGLAMALAGND
jgi:Flp pilus assembly protein TadD